MKKALLILMISILGIGLGGKAQTTYDFTSLSNGQTLYYKITSDTTPYTVEVTRQNFWYPYYSTYPTGDIIIADTISYNSNIYSVTSIGDYAFSECDSVTSVIIPNSLTSIGHSAFSHCESFTSITLPNSLTTIGGYAFSHCTSLTSLIIPNSVTLIKAGAFSTCSNLNSITLPNSIPYIGDFTFFKCSSLTSITIPNSVTTIGENAFFDCNNLTSVTLPNALTFIGTYAFMKCSSLTSIAIPNTVTSVGEGLFWDCTSLISINISNTLTSINHSTFIGCINLTSITIPNSVTSIKSFAFSSCTGLTSIISEAIIPPTLDSTAFQGVSRATHLYVPCLSLQSYQTAAFWSEFFNSNALIIPQYLSATICQGDTYTDYGQNITTPGTYHISLNCDSIILTLNVNQVTTPTNLAVENGQNYLELSWQSDAEYYIIYRDNDSITTTTTTLYRDTNVFDGVTYSYRVKVIDGECEAESIEIYKEFLDLYDLIKTNDISITLYPNPTINNKSTLELEGIRKATDVFVYDITGRKVKTYKIIPSQSKLDIDLTGFAKGIYQVKVLDQTKKLIVN